MNSSAMLSCSFLGKQLSSCLWNASGPLCTTEEELLQLDTSSSAIVLSKSCTLQERQGNPSPRYKDIPFGSINSMGLPNLGVDFYINLSQSVQKPYMISVAGLSRDENLALIQKIECHANHIMAIELNLSCPNLVGKPQVAYDILATKRLLDEAFGKTRKIPIGVKLPPYFDIAHFEEMAELLRAYPIAFITAINSIGNALYIDSETDTVVIKPKNGFGGLGGLYIKPTALANVRKWVELLPHIPIIGCGGVFSGRDVYEHILCGATAVQIGTALMQQGVAIFERLEKELLAVMQSHSYTSLEQFRGTLKVL